VAKLQFFVIKSMQRWPKPNTPATVHKLMVNKSIFASLSPSPKVETRSSNSSSIKSKKGLWLSSELCKFDLLHSDQSMRKKFALFMKTPKRISIWRPST